MYDFSGLFSSYSEHSISIILFTTALTIVLSLLLVVTYDKTTHALGRSPSFVQALLLMSIVTATIMQSIGDSLAISFGIFGALAMIRFRSSISDPRDIAFIFATMAIGISCGVHSYQNAIIGTFTFCLIIFLIKLSPFDHRFNIKGTLRVDVMGDNSKLIEIENVLKEYTHSNQLSKYRLSLLTDGIEGSEYEYSLIVKTITEGTVIQQSLQTITGIKVIRLSFESSVYTTNNI